MSMPAARSCATTASICAEITSTSVPGTMTSLPPPQKVTRSGLSSRVTGSCSAMISDSILPRNAKFAYRKPGLPLARISASRSAQPRNVPSGSSSLRPSVPFVLGWLAGGQSIAWGSVAAIALAVAIGVFRLVRGDKARAVLVSLAAVIVAALVALHTGRAQDFFLIQLLSNVASALLWAACVVIRWPLLGVVVGLVLGQKTRWRKDPALLRAYSRASLAWSGQY